MNQKIQVCRVCQNRAFNPETGVNCGLTNQKPAFEENCAEFNKDEAALKEMIEREQRIKESEEHSGGFAYEKKGLSMGVAGGVLMMLIAVVWFVAGYSAGYIFYYPPVLFIIGVVGVIKGAVNGNISGENS